MKLGELAVLYAVVGAGAAIALLLRHGAARDAMLLAAVWPLYGPFLLLGPGGAAGAGPQSDFLDALKRASSTPLGKLLPDETTARALARRIDVAESRIAEIERLLAQPEFREDAAAERIRELTARGASDAAVAHAGWRVQNIRRLRALRDRSARELDEVRELIAQLRTQAEVVRLAGAPAEGGEGLVRELLYRVEGLDQVLDADLHSPGGAP